MSYIFISYSHLDREYAHRLATSLESTGFGVWIDNRIDYGEQWPRVVQEKLDACAAFIVIMTPRSYESSWVQNELTRAQRLKKPTFPVLLEGELWLSVESFQSVAVLDGAMPPSRFYDTLRRVSSSYNSDREYPFVTRISLNSDGKFEHKKQINERNELNDTIYEMVRKALSDWHLPRNTPNLRRILDGFAWNLGITDAQLIEKAILVSVDWLERIERGMVIKSVDQSSQVYRNWAFTLPRGNQIIDGVIDLLFFTKQQRWTVMAFQPITHPVMNR